MENEQDIVKKCRDRSHHSCSTNALPGKPEFQVVERGRPFKPLNPLLQDVEMKLIRQFYSSDVEI